MVNFRGSFVALITPFDEKGRVDQKTLGKLVEWQISQGTEGLVCCASTGEGPTLTESERKTIAQICVEVSAKRVPIVVGTGVSGTAMSSRFTSQMQKLGADGCLVVTPYYNKPTQKGCILHFQEVAKVGLPVIAYHNPGRAGVRLSVDTLIEIGRIPGVVALKESSTDLDLIRELRKRSSLPILSGEDDLTFETLKEGGVGAISVIGNIFPKAWKQMIHLSLQKDWKRAEALRNRFLPLCNALFWEPSPQGIKTLMSWVGLCKANFRLPLLLPTPETQKGIKKAFLFSLLPQFASLKKKSLP